jgi:hypothetical protein
MTGCTINDIENMINKHYESIGYSIGDMNQFNDDLLDKIKTLTKSHMTLRNHHIAYLTDKSNGYAEGFEQAQKDYVADMSKVQAWKWLKGMKLEDIINELGE